MAKGSTPIYFVSKDLSCHNVYFFVPIDLCVINIFCLILKASACHDDESVDCARMDSLFNVCAEVHHAKFICPFHCDLCDLGTFYSLSI